MRSTVKNPQRKPSAQFCHHFEIRKHIPGTRRQRRTMTILSIRTVGDPVLRSVCDPITVFDDDLARLIDDMLETMHDVGGVGLAGSHKRRSRKSAHCVLL